MKRCLFSLRAGICSVRHRWRHQRNTSPLANMCECVVKTALYEGARASSVVRGVCSVLTCDMTVSQAPVWTPAAASHPYVPPPLPSSPRFHGAPQILTPDRTLTEEMRHVSAGRIGWLLLSGIIICDTQHSRLQLQQLGNNPYKQP